MHLRLILVLAMLAGVGISECAGQGLNDLLRLQPFTAHRVSSSDPNGGNFDMRGIEPGQTLTLAELQGPGVVSHLWFTYMYPSRNALRKLVLRIYFDDIAQPCVEAPLGDFFGLGHSLSYAYASQPLAVGTHSGLNCYWPMPFQHRARLTVSNEGAQKCQALYYQVDYRKLEQPLPDNLHFFASYQQAFPPLLRKPYLILETSGGQGHFVGCNLSIEQQDESWWGEGDIAIHVDGETKPSLAGTGSEDDFGGAWCYSHEFSFPQFGAPLRARFNSQGALEHCTPDLRGKDLAQWRWPEAWKPKDLWNVYRYHIADPIPFRQSIQVTIEHGWQDNERSDWYSSVAYWYQTGTASNRTPLPKLSDRTPSYLRPHDHGGGHWEGEDLVDVAKLTGGTVLEAGMEFWGDLFSHQYALEWNPQSTNDTLALPFSVTNSGRYKVSARLAGTEAGGTFKLTVNDAPQPNIINLFQPPPFPALTNISVAELELEPGERWLRISVLPSDSRSKGKRLLLDRIEVEKLSTTAHTSTIRGQVLLQGTPPAPVPVDLSKYPECQKVHPEPLFTRHYLVGPQGELGNVFVYINKGLTGSFPIPTNKPVLDQHHLGFQPYVMGIQSGQKFVIQNSEPYTDTVHALAVTNREINLAQLSGQANELSFAKPEVLLRVKCELHPWEFAFLGVVEHPFFAVTDAEGKFALPPGLPPGNFVVAAVHPKLGVSTQEVSFNGRENKQINFVFHAKP